MFLLKFQPHQNQNDLQLCRACFDRRAPPPGSATRSWSQEFELTVVDLSHPHVVMGPQLAEVADYHITAHRRVAQQMAKELQEWGFHTAEYDDPSDALTTMMRRFRCEKPSIRQMVQHRIQHVATGVCLVGNDMMQLPQKVIFGFLVFQRVALSVALMWLLFPRLSACGFEGPINFAKGDYEKLKQLDTDIHDGLSGTEFQQRVQEIVQAPGSAAERSRVLENAIADKECAICAEYGLAPNFQGTRFQALGLLLCRRS